MTDAVALNRRTPEELLRAGQQLALKSDVWSTPSVQEIVGKILDLFGLDIPNWQEALANFDALKDAFEGNYTGTDPALTAIQVVVGTIRKLASGIIDPSRIPQLNIGALTNQVGPNLLASFGGFDDPGTMEGQGIWTWDGTYGSGSAKTVADGTLRVLTSEAVAVAEGQTLSLSGVTKWAGASPGGSSPVIRLLLVPSAAGVPGTAVEVNKISGPAYASGEVTLTGSYTVPAGVDNVRLRLTVEAAMTSGASVWWNDISLKKVATSLPQQWVTNLVADLASLLGNLAAVIDQTLISLGLSPTGDIGTRIAAFAAHIGDLLDGVEDNASGLADLQDRTQSLENIIGYGCAYMNSTMNLDVFNTKKKMLFSTQVGPLLGCTMADGGFVLGSKGLWEAQAQMTFDTYLIGDKTIDLDVRVYSPTGTLFFQKLYHDNTQSYITRSNVCQFVVPTSGYKVYVYTNAAVGRGILGGIDRTGLRVSKISGETS